MGKHIFLLCWSRTNTSYLTNSLHIHSRELQESTVHILNISTAKKEKQLFMKEPLCSQLLPWEKCTMKSSVNSLSFTKTPRQKYRLVRQVDRTDTYYIWSKISHPKMMRVSLWDLIITQYSHESALPTLGLPYASPVQGSLNSVLCQEPSLQLLLLSWSLISTDINVASLARQCKNSYQYS